MSSDQNKMTVASCKTTNEEHQSVVSIVTSLPLVSSTYDKVSDAYTATKENHPIVKLVCDAAETGVKTIAVAAAGTMQPILTKLEPHVAAADEYAHKSLDKLEKKLPILQQPADQVISNGKERVVSTVTEAKDTVTGMMDMAKDAVQSSMDATKSMVASGIDKIIESSVAHKVASGIDTLLEKSEELVDHYLPITDEELVKLASSLEEFEMASTEEQKQQKSYYMRLGALSTKLRHRAYLHTLGKLKLCAQSTQEALSQLQQTIDLMDCVKQAVDQKLQNVHEKMNQMWLAWLRKQPDMSEDNIPAQPEMIESQALTVACRVIQHLKATSLTLMSNIQGLPASICNQVQQIKGDTEDLNAAFSTATSVHDLSSSLLSQSREKVAAIQRSLDELLEYVVHNMPLTWLVGPFTPAGEHAEDDEVKD
ncbi:PREDICTED: perilipin-3-like [Crocodylus porosus]|uniref:perilipin-3-like n=1 Tax=Crocodylus porosus TaxID=8502 RepID=UPI00093C4FF4|nr:PREDICTED: perilipin-3-like [Crocodylus porosus]